MNENISILIVEDEPAIQRGLVDTFVFHGYHVDATNNGKEGFTKATSGQYDLLLLDVMLPDMNGFDICEQVRASDRDTPIIMLTARSGDEDIIKGLSLGADDYVSKPFSIAQLVLRVQAVLRRCIPEHQSSDQFSINSELKVNLNTLSFVKSGDTFQLTRREADVLNYLYTHKEKAISREELLNKVWGYAKDLHLETRTVDIHIAKLRRKIEHDAKHPQVIKTIRGAGYQLMCTHD